MRVNKKKKINEYALAEWKRVVLNPLGHIFGWTLAGNVFLYLMYRPTPEISSMTYLKEFVLLPMALMLAVFLCLVIFFRYIARALRPSLVALVTILFLNLYVAVNLCVYGNLKLVMIEVFFPIIIAPIYRKKAILYLQVAISFGMLFLCEFYYEWRSPAVPEETLVVDVVVILLLFYSMVKFELEVITSTNMLGMQSSRDSLTHLYNHERFYEALDEQMSHYAELKETFSIIISDIDNFKSVNDTYGHAFGDEVIRRVAETIMEYRGTRDICARYGGEEFAVIMPNKSLGDAVLQAEKFRREFEKVEFLTQDGTAHHFTISLGVAEYNREYKTASAFFEKADQALYEAKRTGKNKVCCSR